jgi:plasmid stabilization system protein ParE
MNRFVLHPEAYTDLEEIWEYIAADSLDAADRMREENLRSDPLSRSLFLHRPQSSGAHRTTSAVSIPTRLCDRLRTR